MTFFSSRIARLLTLVGLLALRSVSNAQPAAPVQPLPVESFFAEADYRSMQVSPDGKYLTFLTTLGTGKVGIAMMHLETGKIEPLVGAKDENIEFYLWKGSNYVVYGGDLGGNESAAFRSISIDKRRVKNLGDSARERYSDMAAQVSVIDWLRFDPHFMLVQGNKSTGSYNFGVWKLDVRSGERRGVASYDPKPDTFDLKADNNGVIRARSYLSGDKIIYEVRPEPEASFRKVAEFAADDPKWDLQYFNAANDTLYIITKDKTDTGALQALDVRTGTLGPVLYHNPDGEIVNVLSSYDRTELLGVAYETDKLYYHFFSENRAALQKQIDASLPGTSNYIVSASADEKIIVVEASSDRDPGTYFLLNLRKPALMMIGKTNHRINPAEMRPMEPISFKARDGLLLHGYLTRPAGFENKPAPLIINPHGGPFGPRDSWGFNPEVQFLASRGYAVLQVNFRGSGGYGQSFQAAGKREWGGKMQNDLTDGVKWAVEQGIADPDRIAIYGASYGGFAALAGVTFTPELYRCAINYVGVSDLSILKRWGAFGGRGLEFFLRDWVGIEKDYQFNSSPVNFVERIQVPTLHAYGYNDPRVEFEHWKRLEAKLKQFKKPYEIIIQKDEGHGFGNEAGRIDFYRKMETFLAANMAPRGEGNTKIAPFKVLEMPAK